MPCASDPVATTGLLGVLCLSLAEQSLVPMIMPRVDEVLAEQSLVPMIMQHVNEGQHRLQ